MLAKVFYIEGASPAAWCSVVVYVSIAMVKVLNEKLDEGVFSFREFVERFGEKNRHYKR